MYLTIYIFGIIWIFSTIQQNQQMQIKIGRLVSNQFTGQQDLQIQRWITKLPDDTLVSKMAIPGTHDSAAYKTVARGEFGIINLLGGIFGPGFIRCQNMNQKQQLQAGIRYFDLRLCYLEQQVNGKIQEFHFHHGVVYLGTPDDAFRLFKQFLQNNPKEFLILQIQQQNSDIEKSTFGSRFLKYFQSFGISYYTWKNKIPTVGQLRGKVWLIQAAHVEMNQMQIDTNEPIRKIIHGKNYILQNLWKMTQQQSAQNLKNKCIYNHLCQDNSKGQYLKINYISCQTGDKGKFNSFLSTQVSNYLAQKVGIIVMDLPPPELIKKIYQKNN